MADSRNVYGIVVTYNAMQWAERCFTSFGNSDVQLKVIVIDNGSTDGTQQFVAAKFPEIDLVQSATNIGFGRANNLGLKKAMDAGGEYFLLLNQDAWIDKHTVSELLNAHAIHPQFELLSPMHLQSDTRHLDEQFAHYIGPRKSDFFNDLYAGKVQLIYPCLFINAAAWFLTRSCVEKVGLFEPLFFIYGEDQNYAQRALYHKSFMGFVPGARIVHDRTQRKGKKNSMGSALELDTFVLMQLLNVMEAVPKTLANSLKVFTRFGLSVRSVRAWIKGLLKILDINRRKQKARSMGYLIDNK